MDYSSLYHNDSFLHTSEHYFNYASNYAKIAILIMFIIYKESRWEK